MAHHLIKYFKEEIQMTTYRIWTVAILIFIASCILLGRIAYLQIIEYNTFKTLANDNRILIQPIPPSRGLIFDCHGTIIAHNKPSFTLSILPKQITSSWSDFVIELKKIISITDDELNYFNRVKKKYKLFEAIPLKYNLNDTEIACLSVQQYRFPALKITAQLIREYPDDHLFSHVLGYVGRINKKEKSIINKQTYNGIHIIGKTGLEKFYESHLLGYPGYRSAEIDVNGRIKKTLYHVPPVHGKSLHLYLDRNIQMVASNALKNKRGAIVALDTRTGGILALVSQPTFDPNEFVTGINSKLYHQLQTNIDKPLFNRATLGTYPPASTLKPIMALAALDQNLITPDWEFFDPGYYQLPGFEHKYRNWKRKGQGYVNLHTAIMKSNDTYFYQLAVKLGINNIHKYTTMFGYGEKPDLDFPAIAKGLIPSESWKKTYCHQPWYPGETVIAGIGQGYMQTTPLQMALATALIANRGKIIVPRLAKNQASISNTSETILPISKSHWHIVIKAMQDAISAPGTGWRLQNTPFSIAGKTGTAQLISIAQGKRYDKTKIKKSDWDHGLFIAFSPVENPEIALAVIVENEHNSAVLIAKKIFEIYFKNKLDAR
ncbi:MAG: penicillin-binding protein 2 [Endozoicomonadaceae bacterium]|nr:penicillin-binding protein 2 [Endozoicomonadaceae bacterium]MBE8233674.1 penicillin-binding protein 2 [Endozoicomonadaceae bacterium]